MEGRHLDSFDQGAATRANRRRRILLLAAMTAGMATAGAAYAQSVTDVVVMRRSVSVPRGKTTPTPTPTPAACGAFVRNTAPGGYSARYDIGNTASETTALQLCNAKSKDLGTAGICTWNNSSQANAGWPAGNVAYVVGGQSYSGLWTGATADALRATSCNGT
jgi:hypothetical protein